MVQVNNNHNNGIAKESQQVQSCRYKVRKTTKKPSLCYHPKLGQPSKRNSVTAVEFGFSTEGGLGLKELGKGKKCVMIIMKDSRLDQGLQ